MELPEKTNRHHNRTAETPYLFTPITPQNRMSDPPLAETDNICMNPKSRTGPRLRVQFARRELQRPARPMVRRPEPIVLEEKILEEGGTGAENDGVRRELDGRERSRRRDGMFRHYYYLKKKRIFLRRFSFSFSFSPHIPSLRPNKKPFNRLFTHQVILLVFFISE